MPNFKLGSGIKDDIRNNAKKLAARRVGYMTNTFPLTLTQIQDAIMPAEPLKAIRWLKSENVCGVSSTSQIYVRLAPDYLPGLSRYALAQLHLPEGVYPAKHASWYSSSGTTYDPMEHEQDLTLNEGVLDDAARAAVAIWANKAIKERRLELMSDAIVSKMLDRVNSSGEVLARWPFLATLVPDANPNGYGSDNTVKTWKKRFRNGPRTLTRYACGVDDLLRKAMDATEVFLNSAMLLDDYKHPANTIRSELQAWEKLEKDRTFY